MKTKQASDGFGNGAEAVPRLEGMEVEFDEKVTLFPVDLEEIRDAGTRSAPRKSRGGRALH